VALLLAYWASAMRFPDLSDWGDAAWTGLLLGAPLFGLVWLALPAWRWPWPRLAALTLAFAGAAVLTTWLGQAGLANLTKLGAATFAGWLFLSFFAEPSWVALIALIIPVADTLSVWRGPTHVILTQKPGLFEADSIDFPPPGARVVRLRWDAVPGAESYDVVARRELAGRKPRTFAVADEREIEIVTDAHKPYSFVVRARAAGRVLGAAEADYGPACGTNPSCDVQLRGDAAQRFRLSTAARAAADRLGLTDVLFFALFLGAAARFRLRPGWTWLGLLLGFALTGVLAWVDLFDNGGAPALPLIALGFLLPNADLLWRELRASRSQRD
jgi:hypothetical protein